MPDDDKAKPGFLSRLFGRAPAPEERLDRRGDRPDNPDPAASEMVELALPIEALDPVAEVASFESLPPAVPVEAAEPTTQSPAIQSPATRAPDSASATPVSSAPVSSIPVSWWQRL